MKILIFWSLPAFLCLACNQNNPPVSLPTQSMTEASTLIKKAPPVVTDSTYVIDDFLTEVALTKSPYAVSQKTDYPLFGFSFTHTRLSGYTVHEGGYDTDLTYDPVTKKYKGTAIPGLDSIEFRVEADGRIQLTFLKNKKTYTYHKVQDVDSALREVLFAGNYTNTRTKQPVVFTADGTLTGLGAEKTFQPFYDFMGGPLRFDEIVVANKEGDPSPVYYHYVFKDNMLELYEAIQPRNGYDEPEKIGGLRYTLVRD